jgi:tetratricopeptide (TPR) repeat protein
VAEGLVRHATALAAEGRLAEAATFFERAALAQRRARRHVDEARCLVLLAQCLRLAGEVDRAATAIAPAARLAGTAPGIAVAVAAEQAEIALAREDLHAAIDALDRALERPAADTDPELRATLLRRRGAVHAVRGDSDRVDADFAAAAAALATADKPREAARALVERATALHGLGVSAVDAAVRAAREATNGVGDPALAGELDLLEGAVAVTRNRLDDAETFSRSARQHALAAVEPTLYVGASLALSQLADARADRVAAYEALAVGWATLGDLIGSEAAASVFRPHMENLETRWGTPALVAARQAYEDQRRRLSLP